MNSNAGERQTSPLRFAIAGAGMITQVAHLPAILSHPQSVLAGIADPSPRRAKDLCRSYGVVCPIVDNVEALFGEIDACIVASPNVTHRNIAVSCLRAGVSVLIEKPLTVSVRESEEIFDAEKMSPAIGAAGYCTRFRDNIQLVDHLLKEQVFGPVRSFAYQFGTAGGWAPLSAYNLDPKASGGGVTVVSGTHFLDRMLNWFGYPENLRYFDDSLGGVEANSYCEFQFNSKVLSHGIHGFARFSKTVALKGVCVLECEDGRLLVPESDTDEVIFRPKQQPGLEYAVYDRRLRQYPPEMDTFVRQLDDFISSVLNERPPLVTIEQGLATQRLIQDMYAIREPILEDWHESIYSKEPEL